jgi:hypothetical protein
MILGYKIFSVACEAITFFGPVVASAPYIQILIFPAYSLRSDLIDVRETRPMNKQWFD